MKSAIQTLTDGLVYCKNYLRDNPNCSGQNKRIKQQQIIEHEKALKILTTNVDASENTLPIQNVTNRYLFFYEDEGEDGWTFEIEAETYDLAYDYAYDTHGPQVESMMYRQL
jgi:hypothetical protein